MFRTRLKRARRATFLLGLAYFSTVSGAEIQACPAKHNELPFHLYNDNLIVVKGSIASMNNVNIVVDTGTSPTILSRRIADRLHLRGNTEAQLTLEGMMQVESVVLSRIQIGELHADSVRVVVQDLSFLDPTLGISVGAIAGLDVLSSTNFTIDYLRRKILFGELAATTKSVHFEKQMPFLTVKAKINGLDVRLLVDSGTPGILMYRNRLQPTVEQFHSDNTSVETAAGMTHSRWFRASTVALGEENLGQRVVVIADSDSAGDDFDGLLGFRNLGFQKVTFDFENGLFGWE